MNSVLENGWYLPLTPSHSLEAIDTPNVPCEDEKIQKPTSPPKIMRRRSLRINNSLLASQKDYNISKPSKLKKSRAKPKQPPSVKIPETPPPLKSLPLRENIQKTPKNSLKLHIKGPSSSPRKPQKSKYLTKRNKISEKTLEAKKEKLADLKSLRVLFIDNFGSVGISAESSNDKSELTTSEISRISIPFTIVFSPQQYLNIFNENSIAPTDFTCSTSVLDSTTTLEAINRLTKKPQLAEKFTAEDYRFCSYFGTVTTNNKIAGKISKIVQNGLNNGSFYLGWSDLKTIVQNYGLSLENFETDESSSEPLEPSPELWNFEFLILLVRGSYKRYRKNCIKRTLSFFVDCLFEPLLDKLRSNVIEAICDIALHLMEEGQAVSEILDVIDRSYTSTSHNRFIFLCLIALPSLFNIGKSLGIRTIYQLLGSKNIPNGEQSLTEITSLLISNEDKVTNMPVKENYELFLICEKLIVLKRSDPDCLSSLERLTAFAIRLSLNYSNIDSTFFSEIVNRFKIISSCRSYFLSPGPLKQK